MDSRHYTSEWYCFYDLQARSFSVDLSSHNRKVTTLVPEEERASLPHNQFQSLTIFLRTHPRVWWAGPVFGGLFLVAVAARKVFGARRR